LEAQTRLVDLHLGPAGERQAEERAPAEEAAERWESAWAGRNDLGGLKSGVRSGCLERATTANDALVRSLGYHRALHAGVSEG
ncbi:hypothetical protein NDU88_001640, partial [Pleurodeles waltl]